MSKLDITSYTTDREAWEGAMRYADEHAGDEATVGEVALRRTLPLTDSELELLKMRHTNAALDRLHEAMFGGRSSK